MTECECVFVVCVQCVCVKAPTHRADGQGSGLVRAVRKSLTLTLVSVV